MSTYFIGCLHLSHLNIAKMRGFETAEEHDAHLIKEWNSVVNKRDLVYILGDITMESSKPYYLLNKLNGIKKVVLGNHDLGKHVPELLKYVNSVAGMVKYKGNILSHCPIHPMELRRFGVCLHSHIHNAVIEGEYKERYIHVDAHIIDYKPKTLEQLGVKPHVDYGE